MLEYDEKRNYVRMEIDCDITCKLEDSGETFHGRCSSISGAGVSFIAKQFFAPGKAIEINIAPKSAITPPMTAFIEVVRTTKREDNLYEIAASIKTIKAD